MWSLPAPLQVSRKEPEAVRRLGFWNRSGGDHRRHTKYVALRDDKISPPVVTKPNDARTSAATLNHF
jgi:hypothetical protein